MSEGMVARYKERTMAVMIRNNMSEIRCPCHRCNLRALIKPDSSTLEKHLLMSGFMKGYIDEDINNGPLPAGNGDVGGRREGEESPRHDKGDAGHDDDDDTGSDGGGEDADTETPLTLALRDLHVQELLLTETSNAKAAAREKDKLEQMEKDGKTLLYPGCRPGDTRLNVTLKALEMKVQHKWTDVSFNDNLEYWHEKLPEGNTLPRSTEEAKKAMCPLDLPHVKYDTCINDCALYRDEYKELTICPVCGQSRYKRGNRKVPRKVVWYFPITPRLKRYFVDPKEVKLMQ
jgi:hypothetical protein